MSDDAHVEELIRQLGSDEWLVAQRELVRIGSPVLIRLGLALESEDLTVAWRAAWVLGRLKDRRAVPFLCLALAVLPRLAHQEPDKRQQDRRAAVRVEATESLRLLKDAEAVDALCRALEDSYVNVRLGAAKALVAIGAPAVPALLECLKRLPEDAKIQAAHVIGAAGDARAIGPMCDLLQEGHWLVRRAAASGLEQIARRHSDPELRAALPVLRRLGAAWKPMPEELRKAYVDAINRIELATARVRSSPLPAAAPASDSESLPLPSDSAANDGNFDNPVWKDESEGTSWLHRLRSLLRGDPDI